MAFGSFDGLPGRIRVSIGSAIVMKLLEGKLDAAPTTAYLMTYRKSKCVANCGFCPQAKGSKGRADMLSRVSWPVFRTQQVFDGLERAVKSGKTKRVCIQALNYPGAFGHLQSLARAIHQNAKVRISVSCQPLNLQDIRSLADAGTERVGIPVDTATQELFDKIKGTLAGGPYDWKKQFELLQNAVDVFGRGKVSTHFIVGLGETEEEIISIIQRCVNMGVLPALFAFTPIRGTALEVLAQPSVSSYRRIQVARFLILHELARASSMRFSDEGCLVDLGLEKETLERVVRSGQPFLTSGCPDCNRPYYNEKPSGPLYNYPKPLTKKELSEAWKEFTESEA
jgi:biotin synthase